ncbi:MAG: F0F1 ATP synthase subunit A [Bacteroidota bacterium]
MKISKLVILSIICFLTISFSNSTFAGEPSSVAAVTEHESTTSHGEGEEKLNAGKLIMEHIADSHDWHLWGHTSISLPVIIYNAERGLTMFSSARFEHGHQAYAGYRLNEKGKIEAVNELGEVSAEEATINEAVTAASYDVSITKNVVSIFITIAILLMVFISVAKAYTNKRKGLAPTGLQNAIEPIIVFMRDDVIKASIGEKHEKYLPYLLTLFFFIWINNLLGLIPIFPGGANVTGNISVALVLAVLTFIITTISGNKNYWQHIFAMPGVPKGVLVLLTPIEILGMFLRPFVLMIRLFANIAAGHIIALSFFCLIFIFGQESLYGTGGGLGVSPLSLVFTVFMAMLELLVAFLQAYVFTLLSSVYIGAAVEEHHHDDHH